MQPDLYCVACVPALARPRAWHLRLLLAVLGILGLGFTSDFSAQTSAPSQRSVARGADIDIPFETFTLPNGLRGGAQRPQGADRRGEHLVPRGQQGRTPGRTRFRAPVRAPDVQRSENYNDEYFAPSKLAGATEHERHDLVRPHELFPERADDRARPGAVDGVGPHGPPARRDRPGEARRAARRRAERKAAGREPALRPGRRQNIATSTYPRSHPYTGPRSARWKDLNAASLDDVKEWFRTWYGADNAVLALAGDIDVAEGRPRSRSTSATYSGRADDATRQRGPAAGPNRHVQR